MTLAESVLAIMLDLQAPGETLYSLTHVEHDAGPACEDASALLCAAPRWSTARGAWVRPETAAEGRERYEVIAGELAAVATWASGAELPGWPERVDGWPGDTEDFARYLVVIAYHESGFREDVHRGETARDDEDTARGDRGKSWCLIQRQLGLLPSARSERGLRAEALVGVDARSTRNCLAAGADVLARAGARCRGAADPACVFAGYGGGGVTRDDDRIARRVATYHRVRSLWRALEGYGE